MIGNLVAAVLAAAVLLTGCATGATPGATPAVPPAESDPAVPATGSGPGPRVRTPDPGATWQWQLTGPLDLTVDADVYDVDGDETTAEQVRALHARGRYAICYVNAGAIEDFRPDSAAFPADLAGRSNGWPGERWLDIRRLTELEPLLAARFDQCARKHFDAVEPDNIDGFDHETGFPLTAADQLRFNRMLLRLAHARGLAIGLKNDAAQAAELAGEFDFAVVEECVLHDECDRYLPFRQAGKAVFVAEYATDLAATCATAAALGLRAIRKPPDLTAGLETCPRDPGR